MGDCMKSKVIWITILLATILMTSASFGIEISHNSNETDLPMIHIKVKDACNNDVCGHGYKINGVSYIPVRMVMESMGAEVLWDQKTQTVQVIKKENNAELIQTQIPVNETRNLLKEADKQIELLKLIDEQLQLAYDIYKETNDTQWILMNQTLIAERKKSINELSEKLMKHVEDYGNQVEQIELFFDLSDNLKNLITQYEFAGKSLENYAVRGQNEEYKNYLLYRRFALDLYEKHIVLSSEVLKQ